MEVSLINCTDQGLPLSPALLVAAIDTGLKKIFFGTCVDEPSIPSSSRWWEGSPSEKRPLAHRINTLGVSWHIEHPMLYHTG